MKKILTITAKTILFGIALISVCLLLDENTEGFLAFGEKILAFTGFGISVVGNECLPKNK